MPINAIEIQTPTSEKFFEPISCTIITKKIVAVPTPIICRLVYSFINVSALNAKIKSKNEYIYENLYGKSLGKWKPCQM